eukprot:g994.t1
MLSRAIHLARAAPPSARTVRPRYLMAWLRGLLLLEVVLLIPVVADTLGCFHYGFAFTNPLSNITGNPFNVVSADECQMQCKNTIGCSNFGYYPVSGACYLGHGGVLYAIQGAIAGPKELGDLGPVDFQKKTCFQQYRPARAVSLYHLSSVNLSQWPQECPSLNPACTALPDPSFPAETPPQTMEAWPGGVQPTPLQCWPRSLAANERKDQGSAFWSGWMAWSMRRNGEDRGSKRWRDVPDTVHVDPSVLCLGHRFF